MTDTSTEAPAPRKAGRRGLRAISHRADLLLHKYRGRQSEQGRTAPESHDSTQGLEDFGMLGNDEHSDCGAAMVEHVRMLKALLSVLAGVPTYEPGFVVPTTEHTLDWYYAYGVAQGEAGPQPDQGVDNATMLQFLFNITEGKVPTPAGDDVQAWAFVELDGSDLNELKCAVVDFGAVLMGQCLPDNAEQDFEAQPPVPWTIDAGDPADPNEGHDTAFCKYDATLGWSITWGGVQPFTLPTYLTGEEAAQALDCWAMVTEEDVKNGKLTSEQFDALVAQCRAGGTVAPDVPNPTGTEPEPDPEPKPDPPKPDPSLPPAPPLPPQPLPVSHQAWWKEMEQWFEKAITWALKQDPGSLRDLPQDYVEAEEKTQS